MIARAFRSLMLWVCRQLGILGDFFRKPAPLQAGILVIILAALAGTDRWGPVRNPALQVLTATNVLAVWGVALIVMMVLRARRRLVIARFDDFSEKQAGLEPSGFAVLVATSLSELNDLFREFESGAAIETDTERLRAPAAAFEADAGGVDLERAVSAETSFGLGPFKLPVGFVMGLVGRLVQGPRLTGHIHRNGEQRIITVRLAGPRRNQSWQIIDLAVGGAAKEEWRPAYALAHELACRIFTELTTDGVVQWEALSKFAEGVRAYRRSRRTASGRLLSLRQAERRLIESLGEDPNFDLAPFNLGVVFTEKGQLDAAGAAFDVALQRNAQRWSIHYALAQTNHNRAVAAFINDAPESGLLYLSKSMDACQRALALAPNIAARAKVLALTALTQWWRGWRGSPGARNHEIRQATRVARRAAQTAWWSMCAAELGMGIATADLARVRAQTRALTVANLRQIASLDVEVIEAMDKEGESGRVSRYVRERLLRDAAQRLQQARRLALEEWSIHLDLGEVFRLGRQWSRAEETLSRAAALKPDRVDIWALLALARAHRGRHDEANEAMQRAFERFDRLDEDSTNALIETNDLHAKLIEEIKLLAEAKRGIVRRFTKFLALAYRLGDKRFVSLGTMSLELGRMLGNPAELSAQLAAITATIERTKRSLSLKNEIGELMQKGADGIAPLAALLDEKIAARQPWEVAEAGEALTKLYIELDRPADAETCLGKVIDYLQTSLDSEIRRRGFYVYLSRVRRGLPGRRLDALAAAREAVMRDPVNAFERTELGLVHFNLEEYEAAQTAWEQALVFAPDDAELHKKLGYVALLRSTQVENKEIRAKTLETARQRLETALELYDTVEDDKRDVTLFLAFIAVYAGQYEEALSNLLALAQRPDYRRIELRLQLADTYLSNQEWKEAETRFREIAEEIDKEIAAEPNGVNKPIETLISEATVFGIASAFAHLGTASSLAGRGVSLDEALAEVSRARQTLDGLNDEASKREWLARCDFFEGEILLRQDQVAPAIAKLESALAGYVSESLYVTLAEALARRVEVAGKGHDDVAVRRALAYCDEARRIDWTSQLASRIAQVTTRLQALASA